MNSVDAAAPIDWPAFQRLTGGLAPARPSRARITAACRLDEAQAVSALLAQARLAPEAAAQAQALALRLASFLREGDGPGGRAGWVQGLLQEYALSSQEGVALMCLAEALLRIPDTPTRDALIRDKVRHGQWARHVGHSPSLFVNAATWGLLFTGKLMATHSEQGLTAALGQLVAKGGEPLIRAAVDRAMRMMGEQFVTGETVDQALANAARLEQRGFRYSYDMLGEAALTQADADRYRQAYEHAIEAIGHAAAGRGLLEGPGISIKLSALHPRYSRAQRERVLVELYPVLRQLALRARHHGIGLNIDAEEADRLELSLDLLEALCAEPALAGWQGLGFVVQAYQKRSPFVIDHLVGLARQSGHRLMVRLVKGAYWDSEIKRAQVDGLAGYPVYTRKSHTDVSYLACARALLAVPDAVFPQFATHNAHTLSAIYHLADPARWTPQQYEFQCLHGMGEPLYEQVVGSRLDGKLERPCRIYAPVGTHETLLAYLVRRLLENGANTSFVNRVADRSLPLNELVQDPVEAVEQVARQEGVVGPPHPALPLPRALYGPGRINSSGLDLASDDVLRWLERALRDGTKAMGRASPGGDVDAGDEGLPVRNPADHRDVVGHVRHATPGDIDTALRQATGAAPPWAATPPAQRAAVLSKAADLLEADLPRLIGLLVREAGKTCANAIAEVREGVDFLRYDAVQLATWRNDSHRPLGPVVCISPWNFPLAIFTGQVAAALAAGNTVLAKPAEQTPLIAAEVVQRLWQAGVPRAALHLLPGAGETVGAALVVDPRVQGVMFTGSTDVARLLQRSLAERLDAQGRPVTLVAETGGQNAMIVDSSALLEQVVADILSSAFDSAGQRCSALRVLCVQEDVAERLIAMLQGAMEELCIGPPDALAVDVGPVIDADACGQIERHLAAMRCTHHAVFQASREGPRGLSHGTFVQPALVALRRLDELKSEVFGPVLHWVQWRRDELPALIDQINALGYGLTLGVHSRIDETIDTVVAQVRVGNVYVNRNMVGAVVGVQPFGGEGLSGTGPKAGGPLYLLRLLAERPHDAARQALSAMNCGAGAAPPVRPALQILRDWAIAQGMVVLADTCDRFAAETVSGHTCELRGPTGEQNRYRLIARRAVLCLAQRETDLLVQLAAVLSVGGHALWTETAEVLRRRLPTAVQTEITVVAAGINSIVHIDAVLHHGPSEGRQPVLRQLSRRHGPVVAAQCLDADAIDVRLEQLVHERTVSINTAAAGGNASLMTMG